MRIMTWNIWFEHGPWTERRAAIEQVIERESPDVVCLQEVPCRRVGSDATTYAHDLARRRQACTPSHSALGLAQWAMLPDGPRNKL